VPDEKVPARLIEIAIDFTQTRDMLAGPGPDDPHAAELARSAKQAVNTGRLVEADGLLDQAKEAELAALRQARELRQKAQEAEDRHALNAATPRYRGNIALTQLRYAEAVTRFDEATALVPPNHPDEAAEYLERKGDVLEREGDEWGDPSAFEQSIEIYRHVLQLRSRDRAPLAWAKTQSSLGLSLRLHGEFVSGTVDLEEAILAFRTALSTAARSGAAAMGGYGDPSRHRAFGSWRARGQNGASAGGNRGVPCGAGGRTARSGA
jgi:tetratricopeptide (TPR) repeat protein